MATCLVAMLRRNAQGTRIDDDTHEDRLSASASRSIADRACLARRDAQNYPNRPITLRGAVRGGRAIRCAGRAYWLPRCRSGSASRSWSRTDPAPRASPARPSVLRAEPDGYTLLVNALADVQNLHYLSVPYDPIKDFTLIGMVTDGPPLVLIVNANLPYKSVADLVADAKANQTRSASAPRAPPPRRRSRLRNSMRSLRPASCRCRTRLRPGRHRGGDRAKCRAPSCSIPTPGRCTRAARCARSRWPARSAWRPGPRSRP